VILLLAAAAGASFTCHPVSVWDGDSFTCSDGRKIRLAGIAAREVQLVAGGAVVEAGCRPGHPCPATSGIASRKALAGFLADYHGVGRNGHLLVRGKPLTCVSNGSAGGDRVAAWCRSPRVGDLSCAMIRGGYALRWGRYWQDRRC
jgi:endonuclease YncB( thermonuclease family)